MLITKKPRPTRKMRAMIAALGGLYQASRIWGVEYNSLRRFLSGQGQLTTETVRALMEATRLPYEDLIE